MSQPPSEVSLSELWWLQAAQPGGARYGHGVPELPCAPHEVWGAPKPHSSGWIWGKGLRAERARRRQGIADLI